MSSLTGARGSTRRRLVVCGTFVLGLAVLLLAGAMMETPVKQVYWAVYSRLHPMRDGTETYAFSSKQADRRRDLESPLTRGDEKVPGLVVDGVDKGSAAAAAVAAGEKNVVALLPTEEEPIKHRAHEQTAAREAHQREAEVQDAKESKRVQDLADQQLAKATAAFSAEIAAVAGPEEAGRIEDKLKSSGEGQTKLEREAAVATASSGDTVSRKVLRRGSLAAANGATSVSRAALEQTERSHNVSIRHKVRKRRRRRGPEHGDLDDAASAPAAAGADETAAGRVRQAVAPRAGSWGSAAPEVTAELAAQQSDSLNAAVGAGGTTSDKDVVHTDSGEQELLNAVDAALVAQPTSTAAPLPGQRHRVREFSGKPDDYKLTKEMVAGIAPDGVVLLTWANMHYLDFAMNWVGHMQQLNITAYMIGAMDNELLQALVEMNVNNTFAMQTGLEKGDLSWGSPHFFQMGREKIQLIERFTSMGFDVVVSDVDTVWLKDPLPYMARYPDADILASSDHIANTTQDDGLERFPEAGSACNIGILLFRKSALEFAKEWNYVLSKDDLYWDQNAFNDLFRRDMDVHLKRPDRLFKGYDRKLLVGVLPVALFASGHTFYVQDLAERMGLEPYVVHGTFQFSGSPGKRHRFRERMIWLGDEPEHYDPPGGLLFFDLRVDHLIDAASAINFTGKLDDLKGHFDLVNAQLTQIRNGLAIATALNRTLILPRLLTGADRWWAPHEGLIPGSHGMHLPMFCPADHILDLEMIMRDWPEEDHGPNTPIREYSLLQNPRTPAFVKTDKLDVRICKRWETGCTDEHSTASVHPSGLWLKHGLKDMQLRSIFQAYNSTKVLHFDDISAGFGGFASADNFQKFVRRTKVYASIWCCVDEHPGHVWYDMWWDHNPHTDRHGRQIGKWEPITGP